MPFGNKNTEKKQKSKSHLDLGILAPRPSVAKQQRHDANEKKYNTKKPQKSHFECY
jgi:hypothetical protein